MGESFHKLESAFSRFPQLLLKRSPLSRLHEFDEQVSAVREGMARVVPVPLLSLFTGYELETMVSEHSEAGRGGDIILQWVELF